MNATAAFIVSAGTGINMLRIVQRKKSPFSALMGGAAFAVFCVAIDEITKTKLGTGMALLFLLGALLTNGTAFMDTINKALDSY